MFYVRDVFQLQFGKAREARESIGKFGAYLEGKGYGPARLLTDFTGPSYRLILEVEFESLADYEERLATTMSTEEWRRIYESFSQFVESSWREIFRTLS